MAGKISVLTDEFGEGDFEKVAAWLASQWFAHVELRGVWIKSVFNNVHDSSGRKNRPWTIVPMSSP